MKLESLQKVLTKKVLIVVFALVIGLTIVIYAVGYLRPINANAYEGQYMRWMKV